MATRNLKGVSRPIGANEILIKPPHQGTDADGSSVVIVRDENPTRIDEVTSELIYLGWAEYGEDESAPVWKIRRIQLVGTVWEQKYVQGKQEYIFVWNDRSSYTYF